jgi:hypothetical protein
MNWSKKGKKVCASGCVALDAYLLWKRVLVEGEISAGQFM